MSREFTIIRFFLIACAIIAVVLITLAILGPMFGTVFSCRSVAIPTIDDEGKMNFVSSGYCYSGTPDFATGTPIPTRWLDAPDTRFAVQQASARSTASAYCTQQADNGSGSTAIATGLVGVWDGPGMQFTVIEHPRSGERLRVMAQTSFGNYRWYLVRLPDGRCGWITERGLQGLEVTPALVP